MHGATALQEQFGCRFCRITEVFFHIVPTLYRSFLHYVCAGVCAVSSVGPTHQVSTVSGRTTIPTVGHVPVLSLARCAERTSWRRNCCCSVSIVIGGYCSSGRLCAQNKETIMRLQLINTYGEGILPIFLLL